MLTDAMINFVNLGKVSFLYSRCCVSISRSLFVCIGAKPIYFIQGFYNLCSGVARKNFFGGRRLQRYTMSKSITNLFKLTKNFLTKVESCLFYQLSLLLFCDYPRLSGCEGEEKRGKMVFLSKNLEFVICLNHRLRADIFSPLHYFFSAVFFSFIIWSLEALAQPEKFIAILSNPMLQFVMF